MSMTLRLDDEHDAALTKIARAEGVSKNEAVARAIRASAERLDRSSEVRRIVRDVITEDGPLLDRLAQ